MTEFIPWYEAGTELVRCLLCGALLSSGDTELHRKWHDRTDPPAGRPAFPSHVRMGPGCPPCGRVDPCGGPHDCARV